MDEWLVLTPAGTVSVKATACEVNSNGALVFLRDGQLFQAWATGGWLQCTLNKPRQVTIGYGG